MKLKVILNMFPRAADNPTWDIDGEVVEEILDKMEFLPESVSIIKPFPSMEITYGGFVLVNVDDDPKFPIYVHVYHGIITKTERGSETITEDKYFRDEHNIEALLAGMAVG